MRIKEHSLFSTSLSCGMDSTLGFVLTVNDQDEAFIERLLQVLKPETDNTIELFNNESGELVVKCEELKVNSLYSLVDEFLKAYELVRKI
jgi:hypothetical protein